MADFEAAAGMRAFGCGGFRGGWRVDDAGDAVAKGFATVGMRDSRRRRACGRSVAAGFAGAGRTIAGVAAGTVYTLS
jgi:hypothetical protein